MDYWYLALLIIAFGLAMTVVPVIMLIVGVGRLGADTLSERQRRAGEKELREAGIVRAGEE